MVVLSHGDIDKSQYRKFKIRISGKPNDVGMHREMIKRRLKHPEWPLPDVIIVDGGRGQARVVQFEILNFKFEIKIKIKMTKTPITLGRRRMSQETIKMAGTRRTTK